MNRKALRAAVVSALGSAGFDLVVSGAPDTFSGKAKVAVITSAGTQRVHDTRDEYSDVNTVSIGVYVERAAGAGSTVEDSLDDLVLATVDAIQALDSSIEFQRSDGGSPPNRRVDGRMFRYERLVFTAWSL